MASTRGRQVVVPLTNKSGGSVAAGDVVILDSANDTAFTTTTTGRAEVSIGIAQEAIASNATGRVLVAGNAALVNVPASVTRGHYLETHTVAKQATGSSTRRSGSFGQFLTGGTTPTAVLWGKADQSVSGGSALASASFLRTTGDYTTTSTTFVDVDGTNLSLTITTGAHRVLIGFVGTASNSLAGSHTDLDVSVDGTRVGGTTTGLVIVRPSTSNYFMDASFTYLTDALTAGSHTFNLKFRTDNVANTAKIWGSDPACRFWVMEQSS